MFFSLVLQQASTEYQFMKLLSSLVFLGDRERVRKRSENCRGWGFILQGNESEVCLLTNKKILCGPRLYQIGLPQGNVI